MSYLHDLPNRSDNRVIAGQLGAYNSEVHHGEGRLQDLYEQSGEWAGLTGMDYHNWDMNNRNDFSEPNRFLIEQWNNGSLVTVSWHASNPWTGGKSTDMETGSGVHELITPGTDVHDTWMLMLDDVAAGLQELEDEGVVVIWRPFHEMNGGWFWWYSDRDGDQFRALWQHMFNYFTYEKGLDNLLWAYSPNHAYDQWKALPPHYYPGDGYVDIVGLDYYRKYTDDGIWLNGYDELVATGKPVALLEFGPSPASAWPDRPDFDYTVLIDEIREEYPRIVMFQAWEWHWAIPENDNADELMADPWIITRDELPDWNGN
jgi:mannan endo-1,4-beta-mannosidase